MDDEIGSVAVVGSGDVGLLTAGLLDRFTTGVDIRVISDFSAPPREVGKSTYHAILDILHNTLEIPRGEFYKQVKPVWKHSVYFNDWTGMEFHTPFDVDNITQTSQADSTPQETFYEMAHRAKRRSLTTRNCILAERQKTPLRASGGDAGGLEAYESHAYHFNSRRLNEFLQEFLRPTVKLVDDRITGVETDGGEVTELIGDSGSYTADLYVDASGFNRILASELPNSFVEYDLPFDKAVAAKQPIELSDIVPATTIKSGPHGWGWQIDTVDNRDVGYVYNSQYCSDDAAAATLKELHDLPDSTETRSYAFAPGRYKQAFTGNCFVVGDAYGFIEPLQSTALTLNASMAQMFARRMSKYNNTGYDGWRTAVNSTVVQAWKEMYTFVALHYRLANPINEFWDSIQQVGKDGRIAEILTYYNRSGIDQHMHIPPELSTQFITQPQRNYLLATLDAPCEKYDSLDKPIPDAAKSRIETRHEALTDTASEYLSYDAVYSDDILGTPSEPAPQTPANTD